MVVTNYLDCNPSTQICRRSSILHNSSTDSRGNETGCQSQGSNAESLQLTMAMEREGRNGRQEGNGREEQKRKGTEGLEKGVLAKGEASGRGSPS